MLVCGLHSVVQLVLLHDVSCKDVNRQVNYSETLPTHSSQHSAQSCVQACSRNILISSYPFKMNRHVCHALAPSEHQIVSSSQHWACLLGGNMAQLHHGIIKQTQPLP